MFTTRDGGKNWYRLGGATNRAVDIAIGTLDGKKALYALTAAGLEVFDGDDVVDDRRRAGEGPHDRHPQRSHGVEHVFIAGAQGVKAGTIDDARKWQPADAPDAQYASVHGGSRAAADRCSS